MNFWTLAATYPWLAFTLLCCLTICWVSMMEVIEAFGSARDTANQDKEGQQP